MKKAGLLLACVACVACAHKPEKTEVKPVADYSQYTDSSCYTVDLFDEWKIAPPAADVPDRYKGYLGDWGNGAWNGNWCHDLRVLKVTADGRVDVLDMHAPDANLKYPATVFRRKGIIDKDGNLRFSYGRETHVYRLDGRFLVGKREGKLGQYKIALTRKDVVPLPPTRPVVQLAQK